MQRRSWKMLGLIAALACACPSASAQPATSPEDNLPANITRLTYFGERASWSPDGRSIAFISRSFGDAFVADVATGQVRLLTHYPNPGYLRVQYLPNGDFFLIGARNFQDINNTRYNSQEMWVLRAGGGAPIALNELISEGVAISQTRPRIAWAVSSRNYPDRFQPGESAIYVADIVEGQLGPALSNRREVLRARSPDCILEVQDFRDDDNELVYTCYRVTTGPLLADVFGVNLRNGRTTTYRKLMDEYNEAEGIFPDGRHILVESSRDQANPRGSSTIDIWRLRLTANSRDFERLTRWGDYPGYKASNPVVSPDGRTIAFQSGRSGDAAGVGHGLFLLRLE